MKMTSDQMRRLIEANPSSSFWLKKAICTAEGRDALDALNDAQTLAEYCQLRLEEIGVGIG